jgi:hypothetical protein
VGTLPLLTASPSPQGFGTQALDTVGSAVPFTVSNTTTSAITVALSTTGANPDDFIITSSTCPATLAVGTHCTVDIRFAPSAGGARAGALQNTDVFSGTGYQLASLTGSGGSLPQGPAGTNGTNGATGATGATGVTGPQGATGPQGPAGKVELVSCKSVTTGTGKKKKTVQKCTTRLTSSPVKFTITGVATSAVLSRGGVVYATGTATRSGSQTRLLLTPRRRLVKGRYTLTLTRRHKHQRETVTIG